MDASFPNRQDSGVESVDIVEIGGRQVAIVRGASSEPTTGELFAEVLSSVSGRPDLSEATSVALGPVFSHRGHSPVSGHIVGWDKGKGRKTQPRNAPCECGSGKKAKRCCVYFELEKE